MILSTAERTQLDRDIRESIVSYGYEVILVDKVKPTDTSASWNPVFNEVIGDYQFNIRQNIPAGLYNDTYRDQTRDVEVSGFENMGRTLCSIPYKYMLNDVLTDIPVELTTIVIFEHDLTTHYQITDYRFNNGEHRTRLLRTDGDDKIIDAVKVALGI